MDQDLLLWSRRPLSPDLLQYAAEDVLQLLLLQDKLKADLGSADMQLLSKLSTVHSMWYWQTNNQDIHTLAGNSASGFGNLGFRLGSWLTQLLDIAKSGKVSMR